MARGALEVVLEVLAEALLQGACQLRVEVHQGVQVLHLQRPQSAGRYRLNS